MLHSLRRPLFIYFSFQCATVAFSFFFPAGAEPVHSSCRSTCSIHGRQVLLVPRLVLRLRSVLLGSRVDVEGRGAFIVHHR